MHNKARILVVDDEAVVCRNCQRILGDLGHEVSTLQSSRVAIERLKEEDFDLAILDVKMPGIDGMELLAAIKKIKPSMIVIIITGYSTVENAVDAVKLGAADYISKPFTPDELTIRVEKALEKKKLLEENVMLHEQLREKHSFGNMVGKDKKMLKVFEVVKKVAPSESTVLITGESGSGKELVAKAIHYNSLRRERPFVSLDCGALSENLMESELFGHVKGSFTGAVSAKPGLFEVADGGTIFLDEIGNISPATQAKLLRVLQEREVKPVGAVETVKVNVRVIAATNKDLEEMIKRKEFREDLYYRLNIVAIRLPGLKERQADIPLLIEHFLSVYNGKRNKQIRRIEPDVMKILENYGWPGNVRELENVVERVVVMAEGDTVKQEHLPANIQKGGVCSGPEIPKDARELKKLKKSAREQAVIDIEKLFVIEALKRNSWNITKAAKEVKMQRQNFQLLVKKYQIKV